MTGEQQKLLHNLESEWIRQTINGDTHTFEKIYRKYAKTVYGFALRMVNNSKDAEDVVQMTFVKLYKALPGFREASKLSTYILSISRNVCIDLLNKRKKESNSPLENMKNEPVTVIEDVSELNQAVQRLPERMRACFILFAVEGYSQNEIAGIMDINAGTVKAMIFQARQKLRIILELEEEY